MIRIFLIYVLPLIAPTALYMLWALWRLKRKSGDVEADLETVARRAPWLPLAGVGVALLALVLVAAALHGGAPSHEAYDPPHLENGRIVPGEVHPDPPPQDNAR
jgi:hypothetical protein